MEVVFIVVVVIIALFIFFMSRGKKAVQAYVYLAARSDGASEVEANSIASRIDSHSAGNLNQAMQMFCKQCYGGRQLAMISDARLDGFQK